jgi:hypothetical protein
MGTVIDAVRGTTDALIELSLPVKMAWGAWVVWSVVLAAWLRGWRPRVRVPAVRAAPPPPPAPPAAVRTMSKSSVRRPAARPSAVRKPVSPYGTSDFLAVLDEEQQTSSPATHR